MSVGLSAAVRTNLFALQQLATDINRVQKRLATGLRVNTAMDNPAAFFTASALNARASALNTVVDGISNAKQVLEATTAGIDAVQALIASARSLVIEAQASASTVATVTGTVSGLTGGFALSNFESGDTITVSDGTTTAIYTYSNGETLQNFLDDVNNTANLNVDATLSADGRVVLTATSTNNITIGGTASVSEKADIGLVAGTTTFTMNTTRQSLAQQFDTLRDQIDDIAGDAGYNGINLLAGSTLTTSFNETGSSKLTVTGSTVTATGLGVAAATSGSGLSFQTDGELASYLTALDAAEATLETSASTYQSEFNVMTARETFTNSMIQTLQTGADNLVLADTDYEGALLLALQARRELAATSLSLAADADKTALRLFGVG